MNPFILGKNDAKAGKPNSNPYEEFSAKWGLYNSGYNRAMYPHLFGGHNID